MVGHGGKRAGAGRPAQRRKKKVLSVRVFEDIHNELDKEEDKPKAVNEILSKHYKQKDHKMMKTECTGLHGSHVYSEKTCPKCKTIFCFDCCGNTNVSEGGKYEKDFMTCPKCGQDYYAGDK